MPYYMLCQALLFIDQIRLEFERARSTNNHTNNMLRVISAPRANEKVIHILLKYDIWVRSASFLVCCTISVRNSIISLFKDVRSVAWRAVAVLTAGENKAAYASSVRAVAAVLI